jgi:putative FmdB family regulatory protein
MPGMGLTKAAKPGSPSHSIGPRLWRRDVPTYQYHCKECGKSFERTETIAEHEAAKVRCPKCNSKKVTQVPGRVHVVTSKKS